MAAKLKKRALAEYQTQVEGTATREEVRAAAAAPATNSSQKRLKLALQQHSASTSKTSSDPSSGAAADLFPIERIDASGADITALIIRFLPKIKHLEETEIAHAFKKLLEAVLSSSERELEDSVRARMVLALGAMLSSCDSARVIVKDRLADLVEATEAETTSSVEAALLRFFSKFPEYGIAASKHMNWRLFELAESKLRTRRDRHVRIATVNLLGASVCIGGADGKLKTKVLAALGKMIQSPDESRIRQAAFDALLSLHHHGNRLDVAMYGEFCRSLNDDHEGVRQVVLRLIHAMALANPEERVRLSHGGGSRDIRLADDAFGKICNGINDLCVQVRELAARLMGGMGGVASPHFLEQTLDKKLMSNMRAKKSAHDREAKLVASGEWSTGKKWADDAPREELDADSVNLMSFGACGAFIHGLEDEFLSVRRTSVDSLTELSISNPRLASLALDFLVDMFNDEIELVRLRAIESLTTIAGHISLQVHQLETILSALDDFSIVIREKLHVMLQTSTIATKDGLQNVIGKLLDNLKRYPQDRRSILVTFKALGANHSELTLPLVTQLLEIHPFFDTAEPEIDDPAHLCILVLVFNAAQHCPTMEPLLDQHTRRHRHFILDTYPHLMPNHESDENKKSSSRQRANTGAFYKETLARVANSEHLSMANRIAMLNRARLDLKRLGSIDPGMNDASLFASLYLQAQMVLLKCLATKFWSNPQSLAPQERSVVESNLATLDDLCLQLSHRFADVSSRLKRKVQLLKIHNHGLRLVFLVRASNKSALSTTDRFLNEVANVTLSTSGGAEQQTSPFLEALLKKLSEAEDHKPGAIVRLVQPLLLAHPLESMEPDEGQGVKQRHAVIFDPAGLNETPLKYTAGMVLAISVDAEVSNVSDCLPMLRLAIKTPDQKVQLVTPKPTHFFSPRGDGSGHRLLTDALMSHQVWSEAMLIEISIVLDLNATDGSGGSAKDNNIVHLCDPVKVNVLPKAVKRGL